MPLQGTIKNLEIFRNWQDTDYIYYNLRENSYYYERDDETKEHLVV